MMTKQGLFEPINLDDLSVDVAEMLEVSRVLSALAAYAKAKAECMQHRLSGNTSLACNLEVRLDVRYAALPEWARW